ncbi:Leo1-like protein-domain-containing protein [Sparassis latifolia]
MSLADALVSPVPQTQAHHLEDVDDPSSPEDVVAEDEEMHDLFGEDAEPVLTKTEDSATPASSEPIDNADRLSSPERKHREAMEYAEGDEPEHVVEQVLEADAAIPNIPVPRSSDGNFWVIRMPNFVKVDSKPFHSDTYLGPEQEDEEAQLPETLREKSMSIKLKVENTIRWRWVKDENDGDRRQSNSRVVRWSDGSLSLQLGKELFDITQTIDTSGAVPRQAIGGSQPQLPSQSVPPLSQQSQSASGPAKSQGLTYLVAQHKRAEILQCEALVTGYMSLRPTGMQSETHRMLVRAVGQKHNKVARLRMAPDPTVDPEREKMELLKIASRKPKKARGEDDGLGGTRRRRANYSRKRTGDDMWSDDEEEAVFGGASDEDYDGGATASKAKRSKMSSQESKKGPGEYQTDDFLVADSEEEGGDSDGGRRKRTRSRTQHHEEGRKDDLERLEAKIDRQEMEKKRRREASDNTIMPGVSELDTGEAMMDVESEEEDAEFTVRRTRSVPGARKRRAIEIGDEEE